MLRKLLSHALRDRPQRWSEVLILDGKQSTLSCYAGLPEVTYYGPWDVGLWDRRLKQLSRVMMERFERQQSGRDPGRWLIVADEVQRGIRAKGGLGQSIRESLDLIAEQSDALGDVLIVTSQRELNACQFSAYNVPVVFGNNVPVVLGKDVPAGRSRKRLGKVEDSCQMRYSSEK